MVIVLQKLVVDIVWFVRLKYKKNLLKIKKTGNQKGVLLEKILIIYLKCNAVKELGRKKKEKKFVFWGKDPS